MGSEMCIRDRYKLDKILAGEAIDEVIDALASEDQAARLAEGM